MKKIVSLLLVFIMLLGTVTGCGKKLDVEEMPEGTVTLTVGLPQSTVITDYDDNAFTRYIEETTDVDIEFVSFSSTGSEYQQQLALMCSANEELPDVLLGFKLSTYTMNQYGEDGYFLDLTDYIEAYAPNYKAQIEKLNDETKEFIVEKGKHMESGAFYGMPRVNDCETTDLLQSMTHINKTWLDKLGLEVPTTLEELRNVLVAFNTQDPNGNGQADEVPMIGKEDLMNYITNAFVLYRQNNYNVTDGKVWDPVVTDEYRQALIYMNQLVNDGLFKKLCFSIQSETEYKALISPAEGPSKVGIFVGHPERRTSANTDALDEFIALPALSDETGKGGYTVTAPLTVDWMGFITKDCEYPAAAMKFLDAWYLDETMTIQRHGEKGVDWVEEEGKTPYGTDAHIKVINSEAFFSGNSTWAVNVLGVMTHWNYLAIQQEGEGRIAQTGRIQAELWDVMKNGKHPEEIADNLVYTDEEYLVREEKAGTMESYVVSESILFVTGEKDPNNDADWNNFLDTLKKLGRDELMKVCQSAYSRK